MRTPNVVHALPAPHAGPHLITQQAAHNTTPAVLAQAEKVAAPIPGVPTATDLAALDPAVAVTLLVVVGLGIVGFYVGPAIRARFTRPTGQPDPTQATAALPTVPDPTHAVDRAEQRTDRFVDHLLRQLENSAAREQDMARRMEVRDEEWRRKLEQAEREIDQWQQEARRLETMLWQRGRPL